MLRRTNTSIALLIVLILCLTSCIGNSEYSSAVTSFKEIYFKTTDSVIPSDTLATLKNLQDEENERNIAKLKELLDKMNGIASRSNQDEYKQLSSWYNGLVYLRDAYNDWDNLAFENKEKIFNEIVLIQNRRHKK